jgi:tetratricopeptide (TPR) repeat protein
MLFDLRSRGRRRTVQGVYLTLAILMGGGLVLFGVGAGNGLGGLLNAFTGNGSGSNQSAVVSSQEKSALKAVKAHPDSAGAWSQLVQARWSSAGQAGNYNTATASFTASGKKKLNQTTQAWQRYVKLTKNPDANLAVLAARAYAAQGNYSGAASAWQVESSANPNQLKGYECLAVSAYAAKQTRVGDLALSKALSLAPKAQRTTLKTQISAAKTQPKIAQGC